MNNEIEGLIYVPKFVRINSEQNYGDVLTHESYNELLNRNRVQGDYNTEVLRQLFTDANPENTYHIPYIDTTLDSFDERIQTVESATEAVSQEVETINSTLTETVDTVAGHTTTINNILTQITEGVPLAQTANVAEKIEGIDTAENYTYYGKDDDGNIGFHVIPAAVFYDDYVTTHVDQIIIVPNAASVTEAMLTAEVKAKLNREAVADYEDLHNLPVLNDVEFKGNMELSDLGIQPAGNYLTEVPNTYSTTAEMEAYIAEELANYLTITQASTTYRTEAQVTSAISTALTPYLTSATASTTYLTKTDAANTYNRISVGSAHSNPRNGDLLITL